MIEVLAAVLAKSPGQTARELRDHIRAAGSVSVTTADVNRALLAVSGRFTSVLGEPERWMLTPAVMHPSRPRLPLPTQAASLSDATAATGELSLYPWQIEALAAWQAQNHRGIIEAVTGTGKTRVGVAALLQTIEIGGQVAVVVPTCELLCQWRAVLTPVLPPGCLLGLLGDGETADLRRYDVVIAVVNSARLALSPRRPHSLMLADECHRYAPMANRTALSTEFTRRLGLTATLERPDGGHIDWLVPYFGRVCLRLGYRRAIREGVVAQVALALVAVRFTVEERDHYEYLSHEMGVAQAILIESGAVRPSPISAFHEDLARVMGEGGTLAATAAWYLSAMQQRLALLAESPTKNDVLQRLIAPLVASQRALVFTQTVASAERAAAEIRRLGLSSAAVHSDISASKRRSLLAKFSSGELWVATAPRVLDEGVDVPAADLAIVLGASRTRRQMIQRMGRVLRRKADGGFARFIIVFVQDTVEDPAGGAHEGFLEEVEAVAIRAQRFETWASGEEIAAFLRG